MTRNWREQVAHHLHAAANELTERHDHLVQRHISLALGYLEKTSQANVSVNAKRLLTWLRGALPEREETVRMRFSPDELPSSLHAPPSLSPGRNRKD